MRSLVILGIVALCLVQIISAHPRYGGGGGRRPSGRRDGPPSDRRGPRGGRRGLQACRINDGETELENKTCRRGECDGPSLTVTISGDEREVVFCNRTRPHSKKSTEAPDEGVDEGTDEGVIADRLRLEDKPSVEEIMRKSLFRSACKIDGEVKKPCEDCTLGPLEVTVDGTIHTALFCRKESVDEVKWLKVFSAGRRGRGGKSSSESDESDSISSDSESSEVDEGEPESQDPAQRQRGGDRGGRGPGRRGPGRRG